MGQMNMFELTPESIRTILEKNEELCVDRINRYFGPFDTRIFSKSKYEKQKKEGKLLEPSGFTGSFLRNTPKNQIKSVLTGMI